MKKLVKIGNKYAIRKWSLFYMSYIYLDQENTKFWWGKHDEFYHACLVDTEEEALHNYDSVRDKVIKTLGF